MVLLGLLHALIRSFLVITLVLPEVASDTTSLHNHSRREVLKRHHRHIPSFCSRWCVIAKGIVSCVDHKTSPSTNSCVKELWRGISNERYYMVKALFVIRIDGSHYDYISLPRPHCFHTLGDVFDDAILSL